MKRWIKKLAKNFPGIYGDLIFPNLRLHAHATGDSMETLCSMDALDLWNTRTAVALLVC